MQNFVKDFNTQENQLKNRVDLKIYLIFLIEVMRDKSFFWINNFIIIFFINKS